MSFLFQRLAEEVDDFILAEMFRPPQQHREQPELFLLGKIDVLEKRI